MLQKIDRRHSELTIIFMLKIHFSIPYDGIPDMYYLQIQEGLLKK